MLALSKTTCYTSAEPLTWKSVRSTQLIIGNRYIMRKWCKISVFSEVIFNGFGKSLDAIEEKIPKLKLLNETDKFFFTEGNNQIVAFGKEACVFIGETYPVRVTFSIPNGCDYTNTTPTPKPKKATTVVVAVDRLIQVVSDQADEEEKRKRQRIERVKHTVSVLRAERKAELAMKEKNSEK